MRRLIILADLLGTLAFLGFGFWYASQGDFPRATWFSTLGMGGLILQRMRLR